MQDAIIKFDNVSYSYYDEESENKESVLNNFSLDIKKGSFTVILGHNGSGKSTVAKLMNGLYKPTAGTVTVNGISTLDSQNEIQVHKSVGLVFQNPDNQLVASIVEEDVAFGPENLGFSPEKTRHQVDEALKSVDMYEHRRSAPHNLSGGQKQRVAIAGIIAMEPDCIVLDEPTAMLDPKGRSEVMRTILKLNKEKNITIVLITHFMEEARFADRVLVMNDGVISADSVPNEIFSDVNFLKSSGLDIPQTTDLLNRLKNDGIAVACEQISVEDTARELSRILNFKTEE